MEFKSFEEAMEALLGAEEGSELQNQAAAFAIKNAPEDLKDQLASLAMKNMPEMSGINTEDGETIQ